MKCKYFAIDFAQITNTKAEMCFILTGGQELSVRARADGTIRIARRATQCSAVQCPVLPSSANITVNLMKHPLVSHLTNCMSGGGKEKGH